MLNPENVATPATAATTFVPARVPVLGFVPIATVTFPVNTTCVAVPGVADALKDTGDPAPVACTVWVPATVPSVQVVAAMPLVLLVDVVGLTEPLPVAGVHVTVTPATGLLN